MSSLTFFLLFIPVLALILLMVNFVLAPHKPNKDKDSQFECGFTSFVQMSRMAFTISFFIYALLFLLFDLEILLVYPYVISSYNNDMYGLIVMLIFFILLTIGFIYELGNKALQIDSRQTIKLPNSNKFSNISLQSKFKINNKKLFTFFKVFIIVLFSLIYRIWVNPIMYSFYNSLGLTWIFYIYCSFFTLWIVCMINIIKDNKINLRFIIKKFIVICISMVLSRTGMFIIFSCLFPVEMMEPSSMPGVCHILADHTWSFSETAKEQINRGYINGINQPACNEIADHLEAVGVGTEPTLLSNKNIPLEVRKFLATYYHDRQLERYNNAVYNSKLRPSRVNLGLFTIADLREVER